MTGEGSVPFAHVAIDHSHSQQPVPKGFSLFKRCEWLVVNYNVANGRHSRKEQFMFHLLIGQFKDILNFIV